VNEWRGEPANDTQSEAYVAPLGAWDLLAWKKTHRLPFGSAQGRRGGLPCVASRRWELPLLLVVDAVAVIFLPVESVPSVGDGGGFCRRRKNDAAGDENLVALLDGETSACDHRFS